MEPKYEINDCFIEVDTQKLLVIIELYHSISNYYRVYNPKNNKPYLKKLFSYEFLKDSDYFIYLGKINDAIMVIYG